MDALLDLGHAGLDPPQRLVDAVEIDPALALEAIGQVVVEPGQEPSALLERLRLGTKLRVVPNPSCLAAALFPRYQVVRGEQVVDEWRPCRGW